jgi:hypothetical protein
MRGDKGGFGQNGSPNRRREISHIVAVISPPPLLSIYLSPSSPLLQVDMRKESSFIAISTDLPQQGF